ncbi:MAG: hypothetical protein HYY06_02445 [Deltaproteobacteria bacterium]|nr:hypothetical protein [Deltaproteobacteria bacterium]
MKASEGLSPSPAPEPQTGGLLALFAWVLEYRARLWMAPEHCARFDAQLATATTIRGLERLRASWDSPFLSDCDDGAPEPDRTRAALAESAWWTFEGMRKNRLAEPVATWVTFVELCRYAPERRVRKLLAEVRDDPNAKRPRAKGVLFAARLLGDSERAIEAALARFGMHRKRR